MDQLTTSIGFSCLTGNQPKSLVEWNAQYEALSLRQDWWFKAGAAVISTIRSAKSTATQPATAYKRAHA